MILAFLITILLNFKRLSINLKTLLRLSKILSIYKLLFLIKFLNKYFTTLQGLYYYSSLVVYSLSLSIAITTKSKLVVYSTSLFITKIIEPDLY